MNTSAAKMHNTIFECDCCGACCRKLILEADCLDVMREPRIASERPNRSDVSLPVIEQTWVLNADGGECNFLGHDNRCTIYPTRPGNCVGFVAGSIQCQNARKWAELPPLLMVERESPTIVDVINSELLADDD